MLLIAVALYFYGVLLANILFSPLTPLSFSFKDFVSLACGQTCLSLHPRIVLRCDHYFFISTKMEHKKHTNKLDVSNLTFLILPMIQILGTMSDKGTYSCTTNNVDRDEDAATEATTKIQSKTFSSSVITHPLEAQLQGYQEVSSHNRIS